MKQVLKGGIVVGGSGSFKADVLIDGEKVTAVGTGEEIGHLADKDTRVVDVEGCLLFPGFIDAHTHFDLHVAGTVTADDLPREPRRLSGAAPPPSWTSEHSTQGRAWLTASGTGMKSGRQVLL